MAEEEIEDLAKHLRMRKTWKAQLTKNQKKLADYQKLTLDQIDPHQADKLVTSTEKIQGRLSDALDLLCENDPGKTTRYEADMDECQSKLDPLLEGAEAVSRLGWAFVKLDRVRQTANGFSIDASSSGNQLAESLQTLAKDHSALRDQFAGEIRTNEKLSNMVESIQDKLATLTCRLPDYDRTPGTSVAAPTRHDGTRRKKLPMLEIPKFKGDPLEWPVFWNTFRRDIHLNRQLEDDEKMSYLRQCICDKSQSNLIDTMAASYTECVDKLKDTYDEPRRVHQHFVKRIYLCNPAKEDSVAELTRLYTNGVQAKTRIAETKFSTLDQERESFYETLLPPVAARRWMELHPSQAAIPTFDELLEFIRLQSKLCGKSQPAPDRPSGKPRPDQKPRPQPDKYDRRRTTSGDERPTRAAFATNSSALPCMLCKEHGHSLYTCPTFLGQTVDHRSQYATSAKLCYNCLCPTHDKRACKSTYTCRKCSGRHHTLLHKERGAPRRDAPETATAERTASAVCQELVASHAHTDSTSIIIEDTISPTLDLTAQSPAGQETTVTALFDPGAQLSLITNRVANRLGLKKQTCNVRVVQALGSGTVSANAVVLNLTSQHVPGTVLELIAVVVPKIGGTRDSTALDQPWTFLNQLELADPHFRQRRKVDVILGQNISRNIVKAGLKKGPVGSIWAQDTIWGWMVQGQVGRPQRLLDQETTATCPQSTTTIASLAIGKMQADLRCDQLLTTFFNSESVEEDPTQSVADQAVLTHFENTRKILPTGRYQTSLPRRPDCQALGTTRGQALKRYLHNEASLTRRKALQPFQLVMKEYFHLHHAEVIPTTELNLDKAHYYMPMHAVVKATSTTTKLRVVFDASAASSNGLSLNDVILVGPTVYPPLANILLKFRIHKEGMTADISKMYREIALHPDDQDLHRFVWRDKPTDPIQDCRMLRVTFGVASSPFMATQVLQDIAHRVEHSHPLAARALHTEFYVDDYLSGADTTKQALTIQRELQQVLGKHKLTLRKWRSSSKEVLNGIPLELQETEVSTQPYGDPHYLKTLGVEWNAQQDTFHISTSVLTLPATITKRALTSDVAKTFDVLGWFAPTTLTMKVLIQRLWAANSGWDEQVPPDIQEEWSQWREELPTLLRQPIVRRYFSYDRGERIDVSLQGFADASLKGYAAVVYLRTTYTHGQPTVVLVQAKTKVAPLKGMTIPRLELCGAQLLAKLITIVRTALEVPLQGLRCWTDSQIVRYWLDGRTRPHRVFVANRVRRTLELVPPKQWSHVPGKDNPADCASRGITPRALQALDLWWHGPAWLSTDPITMPPQPQLTHLNQSVEEVIIKKTIALITKEDDIIESRYSSYACLRRTVSWILRFARNCKPSTRRPSERRLTMEDIQAAEALLYRRAQKRMISRSNISSWQHDKSIRALNPTKDHHGIYRVNGRLDNSPLAYAQRHPIIMEGRDVLTKKIIRYHHFRGEHAGPTLLMSMIGRNHYVIRGLLTCKAIVRSCVECIRTRLTTQHQMMGQLPAARVNPSRPFSHVGTDFAGPVTLKKGHTRKPVHVKGYVCVFVCLSTKATHLEVVSSLSTEAFLDCLTRFTSRRGLPECIYSDNGSNFTGAARELEDAYHLLRSDTTQEQVTKFCVDNHCQWKFNPARAPHFGGLWEAAVKAFKLHFRRIVKTSILTYEQITTLLCRIEAALNSRPLMPVYTHSEEGVDILTPGHFLVGQPLNALPEPQMEQKRNPRSHYLQVRQLAQLFWARWSADYLTQLQRRTKWQKPQRNVEVGDIVLVRGETTYPQNTWPMARVMQTFAGNDGLIRVVELLMGDKLYRRPIAKLTVLVRGKDEELEAGMADIPLPPAGNV